MDKRPEQLTPKEWGDLTGSLLTAKNQKDVNVDVSEDDGGRT